MHGQSLIPSDARAPHGLVALQFANPDIFEAHLIRPQTRPDGVDLQTDQPARVLAVAEVGAGNSIEPGPDMVSLSHDAIMVPLVVLEGGARLWPQMSSVPLRVKTPLAAFALPATATAPMSWCCQGGGIPDVSAARLIENVATRPRQAQARTESLIGS
jgi:hypothetical protein